MTKFRFYFYWISHLRTAFIRKPTYVYCPRIYGHCRTESRLIMQPTACEECCMRLLYTNSCHVELPGDCLVMAHTSIGHRLLLADLPNENVYSIGPTAKFKGLSRSLVMTTRVNILQLLTLFHSFRFLFFSLSSLFCSAEGK